MFEHLTPSGIAAAALLAPPGPDVIAALSTINPLALAGSARVDLLIAWERQASWVAARSQPVLVAVGTAAQAAAEPWLDDDDPGELTLRSAHAEIGAALRVPDSTAGIRLDAARVLTVDLPAVQAALQTGDISYSHACAIVDATRGLQPYQARQVADRVLRRTCHQTVAQLRRCLRRAVFAIDPDGAADRVRKARDERGLDWWPRPDGMAELRLIASATDVMAVFNAANTLARKAKKHGPKRDCPDWLPIAALRADALVHLAARCAQPPPPVAVNVTIDLATLLGPQDHPGALAGYGPLPAPLARRLAADGRWRRLVCDPMTGALLDLGRSSYQPTAELARFVKTRDRSCIFPTCDRAAQHCETDHDRSYRTQGGRTDRINLHSRCGNHHTLKHHTGWKPRPDSSTGQSTWTSPLGRHYVVVPDDHRAAVEPCPF